MKFYIGIVIYNIILLLAVIYLFNFASNDFKMSYLKDVSGLKLDSGLEYLSDYEINVLYVESEKDEAIILYSQPKANSLVYEKQSITLYVSSGYNPEKYESIKNKMYEDSVEYLESIKKTYNLNIIINYKEDRYLPDGLIYDFQTDSDVIINNDTVYITVIKNTKYIIIPDFYGWYYKDVLNYAKNNEIKIDIIYTDLFYTPDFVIGQSVKEGTKVLKNSNPIIIYVAKRS